MQKHRSPLHPKRLAALAAGRSAGHQAATLRRGSSAAITTRTHAMLPAAFSPDNLLRLAKLEALVSQLEAGGAIQDWQLERLVSPTCDDRPAAVQRFRRMVEAEAASRRHARESAAKAASRRSLTLAAAAPAPRIAADSRRNRRRSSYPAF